MTEPMYRFISYLRIDAWGRQFLSGVLLALVVATLAMFVAIPVWNEVRGAKTLPTADRTVYPPPFDSEESIRVGTDSEVASSSAVGI